jgi:hypothetical protein
MLLDLNKTLVVKNIKSKIAKEKKNIKSKFL